MQRCISTMCATIIMVTRHRSTPTFASIWLDNSPDVDPFFPRINLLGVVVGWWSDDYCQHQISELTDPLEWPCGRVYWRENNKNPSSGVSRSWRNNSSARLPVLVYTWKPIDLCSDYNLFPQIMCAVGWCAVIRCAGVTVCRPIVQLTVCASTCSWSIPTKVKFVLRLS